MILGMITTFETVALAGALGDATQLASGISEALVATGAVVLAQDEETSVVWGMPGAIVRAGLADQVLPLSEIPGVVAGHCRQGVGVR